MGSEMCIRDRVERSHKDPSGLNKRRRSEQSSAWAGGRSYALAAWRWKEATRIRPALIKGGEVSRARCGLVVGPMFFLRFGLSNRRGSVKDHSHSIKLHVLRSEAFRITLNFQTGIQI